MYQVIRPSQKTWSFSIRLSTY